MTSAHYISQGSTSGPIVKSAVKTQVQPEFVPSNNKVRNRLPHLAPFGTKSHSTRGRSLETHVPLKKAEVNQTSDTTKKSACAEHFRYIANMSSFSDSRFKDIAKDILKNPEDSWKAFISLSKDSVWIFVADRIIVDPFNRKTLQQNIGRRS
jgi:hypothetical protein